MVTSADKAIVALVVGLVFFLLGHFNFVATDSLNTLITTVVTAGVVYFVPNKEG